MIDSRIALMGRNIDLNVLGINAEFGARLRQQYDARKQQKALNEIMSNEKFDEQMAAARSSGLAGAMVPLVIKHRNDQRNADLLNDKTEAEIGKINSESNKNNASAGKTTAETQGLKLDNSGKKTNLIGNAAFGNDPVAFRKTLQRYVRDGVLGNADAFQLFGIFKDISPEKAAERMRGLARQNPELAKVLINDQLERDKAIINARSKKYATDQTVGLGYHKAKQQNEQFYISEEGKVVRAGIDADFRERKLQNKPKPKMPFQAVKYVDDIQLNIDTADLHIDNLNKAIQKVESNGFDVGIIDNAGYWLRGQVGNESEYSKNYNYVATTIRRAVNDSLKLAKGVQTDGDAERELKAILNTPMTSKAEISSALVKLRDITAEIRKKTLARKASILQEYGRADQGSAVPNSQQSAPTGSGKIKESTVQQAAESMGVTFEQAKQHYISSGIQVVK